MTISVIKPVLMMRSLLGHVVEYFICSDMVLSVILTINDCIYDFDRVILGTSVKIRIVAGENAVNITYNCKLTVFISSDITVKTKTSLMHQYNVHVAP